MQVEEDSLQLSVLIERLYYLSLLQSKMTNDDMYDFSMLQEARVHSQIRDSCGNDPESQSGLHGLNLFNNFVSLHLLAKYPFREPSDSRVVS